MKKSLPEKNVRPEDLCGASVLVCGGTYQQGIHLVRALLYEGADVTLTNRGSRNGMYGRRVSEIKADRNNREAMRTALGGKSFDYVIDTSAYNGESVAWLLENVKCSRYVLFSSNAVYNPLKPDQPESDFDAAKWDSSRYADSQAYYTTGGIDYQIGKKMAEKELLSNEIPSIIIRMPYMGGIDEISGRLQWLVNAVKKEKPITMHKEDFLKRKFSMISTDEAGRFVIHALRHGLSGIYNLSSEGTISVDEICKYISRRTGKTPIYVYGKGQECPYNYIPESSLNTEKAKAAGYRFSFIDDWLWSTLDYFIQMK